MKKSSIFHWFGRIFGVWGGLALVGAWIAGENGTVLGFSQGHLYNDATVLVLLSISALVCGFWYWNQEKGN